MGSEDEEQDFCYFSHNTVPDESELPWGDAVFDAFVAIVDASVLTPEMANMVASRLVRMNNDWVETLGADSEMLHDLMDEESVKAGRQQCVGDGSPMTAWFGELTDMTAMAEHVARGGLGACSNKLVVVIGGDAQGFAELVRRAGEQPCEHAD